MGLQNFIPSAASKRINDHFKWFHICYIDNFICILNSWFSKGFDELINNFARASIRPWFASYWACWDALADSSTTLVLCKLISELYTLPSTRHIFFFYWDFLCKLKSNLERIPKHSRCAGKMTELVLHATLTWYISPHMNCINNELRTQFLLQTYILLEVTWFSPTMSHQLSSRNLLVYNRWHCCSRRIICKLYYVCKWLFLNSNTVLISLKRYLLFHLAVASIGGFIAAFLLTFNQPYPRAI